MRILIALIVQVVATAGLDLLTGNCWGSALIGFVVYMFYLAISEKPCTK